MNWGKGTGDFNPPKLISEFTVGRGIPQRNRGSDGVSLIKSIRHGIGFGWWEVLKRKLELSFYIKGKGGEI